MELTLTRQTPAQHIVWLDVVRLVAMFTVVCCHCTDPFNFYPGTSPDIVDIKFWGAVYGAALRPCVPLFVMITGALLFSLGASLLSGILIRPLVSTKTANARSILLLITLLVAMFILSATATAASHISYSAALTMSIILTVVGAVGTAVSTVSACRYIKENWQF